MHSDDETSINYPERAFQLSGSRLINRAVTYSSNGDGSINVYHISKRLDGKNPAEEKTYKQLIDNTERVSINKGDDANVEKLVKIIQIYS